MGRNKDSLIELAAKLTGENCGEVKTKKDALKKIACFYAGQEVECNTVADALQCIASHCEGGGGGESGSVKLTKVYAWFFYRYQSTIYTFTRNPKVDDMAFSIEQSDADDKVSFVKIIGVNTDDSGNVQSIDTNGLTGYGYYGEAMLFDGYPIKEKNGYPQGFVNADNGTIQVNLTFSKADIEPSEHATVNKWQVNEIDSNLHAYAETTDDLFIGRKVFIVNKDNVAIGDFAHFDDLEAFDVINTDNPYYVFYGDTNTLPRTVQLISATITNAQDYIGVIDGTCVINLTITE
jgi:hypothetical protein